MLRKIENYLSFILPRYIITTRDITPLRINRYFAPRVYQITPAIELATMVQRLCNAEKVPMAVAVSFLSVILLIQAFDTPSVAEAYNP